MVVKKSGEASGKAGKPMFVSMVLDPLWKAYSVLDAGVEEGRVRGVEKEDFG